MGEEVPEAKRTKIDGEEKFSACFDFTSMNDLDPSLFWKNEPAGTTFEKEVGMKVITKPKADFWRKTFRNPPADRASGHALLHSIPEGLQKFVAQTTFSLKYTLQFDQAGIIVFIDDQHWLKAGIEVESGAPTMSCVITNGESDWSYKSWPTAEDIEVRVTVQRYSSAGLCECKVEYEDKGSWCFLREGQITISNEEAGIHVGVTCCAPKKEKEEDGMEAIFKSFKIQGE